MSSISDVSGSVRFTTKNDKFCDEENSANLSSNKEHDEIESDEMDEIADELLDSYELPLG